MTCSLAVMWSLVQAFLDRGHQYLRGPERKVRTLTANVEQVKTVIKWRVDQSEAMRIIVHEDNCSIFLEVNLWTPD